MGKITKRIRRKVRALVKQWDVCFVPMNWFMSWDNNKSNRRNMKIIKGLITESYNHTHPYPTRIYQKLAQLKIWDLK